MQIPLLKACQNVSLLCALHASQNSIEAFDVLLPFSFNDKSRPTSDQGLYHTVKTRMQSCDYIFGRGKIVAQPNYRYAQARKLWQRYNLCTSSLRTTHIYLWYVCTQCRPTDRPRAELRIRASSPKTGTSPYCIIRLCNIPTFSISRYWTYRHQIS